MRVSLGVPRIKEIINATKKISTPVIFAPLIIQNDLKVARIVKGRIEKTTLGDVAEYIEEVYSKDQCYLSIKLDMPAIDALQVPSLFASLFSLCCVALVLVTSFLLRIFFFFRCYLLSVSFFFPFSFSLPSSSSSSFSQLNVNNETVSKAILSAKKLKLKGGVKAKGIEWLRIFPPDGKKETLLYTMQALRVCCFPSLSILSLFRCSLSVPFLLIIIVIVILCFVPFLFSSLLF
jgi:hypothetical protein